MNTKRFSTFWIFLALCLLPLATISAQGAEDEPAINLASPRFDVGQNLYLLDLVYSDPTAIGSVQISIINAEGVEVVRLAAVPDGRNQSVTLKALDLEVGQTYRVELVAFTPLGELISVGQGNAILASREFNHVPGILLPVLGLPIFRIEQEPLALHVELDVSQEANLASYRLILFDNETNTVALDLIAGPSLPLVAQLDGVPPGAYVAQIQAIDAAGNLLASTAGEFAFDIDVPVLGQPLFDFADEPPTLNIRLQPDNEDQIVSVTVSLIDTLTNEVILEFASGAGLEPLISVPLDGVAAGEYLVVIRAFDGQGQTAAVAEEEITYFPPQQPGILTRILNGLVANQLILLLIVFVLLVVVGWLIIRTVWERRATATPVLVGWDNSHQKAAALPIDRSRIFASGEGSRLPSATTKSPVLKVTVMASSDARQIGRAVLVKNYPFTIGRADSDLNLGSNTYVLRRHAELRFDQGRLMIIDQLSRNGTFIDGERLAAEATRQLDPTAQTGIGIGRDTKLVLAPSNQHPTPAKSGAGRRTRR